MLNFSLRQAILWAFAVAAALAAGCVSNRPHIPVLSPEFYGVWTNVDPRFFNWWEISQSGAINYGIALDAGKCGAREATVLDANHINVPFGNSGTVLLHLTENGLLLFEAPASLSAHKKINRASICQRADGSYFEAAPYPETVK